MSVGLKIVQPKDPERSVYVELIIAFCVFNISSQPTDMCVPRALGMVIKQVWLLQVNYYRERVVALVD